MTRHKKFIKSEKAKTKLKSVKLPKGLNVTKTEFKVRKIIIREQIKEPFVIGDGTIVKSNIKVIPFDGGNSEFFLFFIHHFSEFYLNLHFIYRIF